MRTSGYVSVLVSLAFASSAWAASGEGSADAPVDAASVLERVYHEREIERLPESAPQGTDFSEAVKTRTKFALNEANGHRSCTLVNLGIIALRLRRKLYFDPRSQRFAGDEEANRLIDQPMRAPWHV